MIPDIPIPIEAWKGFAKHRGKFVSPIFHPDLVQYQVGEPQRCACHVYDRDACDIPIETAVKEQMHILHGPTPSEICGCGFWVTKTRAQALGTHVGRVRIWGKVIEYDQGYRSEWIELLETPKRVRPFNLNFFPFDRTIPGYLWLCGILIFLTGSFFTAPWRTYLTVLGDGCWAAAFGWFLTNLIRRKLKERKSP